MKTAVTALLIAATVALGFSLSEPIFSTDFRVDLTAEHYRTLLRDAVEPTQADLQAEYDATNCFRHPVRCTKLHAKLRIAKSVIAYAEKSLDEEHAALYNAKLHDYAINEGGMQTGPYYVPGVISNLFESEPLLGVALLFFAIVFPAAKLICVYMGMVEVDLGERKPKFLPLAQRVARWSAADVFVVALIVTIVKSEAAFHLRIEPEAGFYAYVASFVLSSAALLLVDRTAAAPENVHGSYLWAFCTVHGCRCRLTKLCIEPTGCDCNRRAATDDKKPPEDRLAVCTSLRCRCTRPRAFAGAPYEAGTAVMSRAAALAPDLS